MESLFEVTPFGGVTETPRPSRDRIRELPPPLALYAASRRPQTPSRKPPPRWLVPVLVVGLIIAAGVAVIAYWPPPGSSSSPPLRAAITISHAKGPHPLAVAVTANVTGGVAPYQYMWSFGDGGWASSPGASHSYAARGLYQVTLDVTDHDNQTASAGATVRVEPVFRALELMNASNQSLGPGETNAWIAPFTVPPTAVTAWINGTATVTGCSLGGNCKAFVEILDPSDEANLTRGAAITNPIWCLDEMGACQSNQTTRLAIDLSDRAGETDYLVVFNTDLVWSQTVSAQISLSCWY